MPYYGSHAWKVRQKYGSGLLLMPGAAVIIERGDGAILLMRRIDTGNWGTLGGWVEEGQSYRDTAVREVLEEGRIQVDPKDLIPIATLSDPALMAGQYPNGHKFHAFTQLFLARKWTETDNEPDETEVSGLRFFKSDEINDSTLDILSREQIRAYRDYVRTGRYQSH